MQYVRRQDHVERAARRAVVAWLREKRYGLERESAWTCGMEGYYRPLPDTHVSSSFFCSGVSSRSCLVGWLLEYLIPRHDVKHSRFGTYAFCRRLHGTGFSFFFLFFFILSVLVKNSISVFERRFRSALFLVFLVFLVSSR